MSMHATWIIGYAAYSYYLYNAPTTLANDIVHQHQHWWRLTSLTSWKYILKKYSKCVFCQFLIFCEFCAAYALKFHHSSMVCGSGFFWMHMFTDNTEPTETHGMCVFCCISLPYTLFTLLTSMQGILCIEFLSAGLCWLFGKKIKLFAFTS